MDARLADKALDDVRANRIVHGLLGKAFLYPRILLTSRESASVLSTVLGWIYFTRVRKINKRAVHGIFGKLRDLLEIPCGTFAGISDALSCIVVQREQRAPLKCMIIKDG